MTTSDERAEQERAEYGADAQAASRAEALFAILAEARKLEDNLTAVQARYTQQEEEIRALRRFTQGINVPLGEVASWIERGGERIFTADASIATVLVGDFMRAFGQSIAPKPTIPSDDVVRLRLRLIAEEFFELLDAAITPMHPFDLSANKLDIFDAIDDKGCAIDVDLPSLCDALADLDYVIEGTRLACGVNGKAIAEAVHRSNMAKLGGPIDANGKVQKPDGWTPPDIKALLIEQGWEP